MCQKNRDHLVDKKILFWGNKKKRGMQNCKKTLLTSWLHSSLNSKWLAVLRNRTKNRSKTSTYNFCAFLAISQEKLDVGYLHNCWTPSLPLCPGLASPPLPPEFRNRTFAVCCNVELPPPLEPVSKNSLPTFPGRKHTKHSKGIFLKRNMKCIFSLKKFHENQ